MCTVAAPQNRDNKIELVFLVVTLCLFSFPFSFFIYTSIEKAVAKTRQRSSPAKMWKRFWGKQNQLIVALKPLKLNLKKMIFVLLLFDMK